MSVTERQREFIESLAEQLGISVADALDDSGVGGADLDDLSVSDGSELIEWLLSERRDNR